MSQTSRAEYYQAVKAAGVKLPKPYNKMTTAELEKIYNSLVNVAITSYPPQTEQTFDPPPPVVDPRDILAKIEAERQRPEAPVGERDPEELAGQRQNSQPADEPIRTDPATGFIWYQEEVQKAGYAKPRGRRVLKYNDPGYVEEKAKTGDYEETFEVAGTASIPSEAKITLPSYQVGIYKDPRMPFKTHVYNGLTGFDLFEVQNYYGGAEMVPEECKRIYVENVLCYDIRTTVRAIQTEYRHMQLQGKA